MEISVYGERHPDCHRGGVQQIFSDLNLMLGWFKSRFPVLVKLALLNLSKVVWMKYHMQERWWNGINCP